MVGIREACDIAEDMVSIGLTQGIEGKRVVIQGLGNVGYHAARLLQEEGAELVGFAEYEGAIYDSRGLDVDEVINRRKESGSILNCEAEIKIENSQLALEWECDILIPAALENQITTDNVDRIQAKIIGEAANGPITAAANERLLERGVWIIPDTFLNAGGVTR